MRVLVFDPFSGAAGDMVCGALLDLGADSLQVTAAMRSVVADPEIRVVERAGIRAVAVNTRATTVQRSLDEVLVRVKAADAPREAIEMACRVFFRIAEAEEDVHGKTAHFHEVGADDAIAEVVGACTALHSLGVDAVATGTLRLGGGSASTHHGTYPVPAPATLAILKRSGLPVEYGPGGMGELCTPTGAALLSEMVTLPAGSPLRGRVVGTGYGAGTRDYPSVPNVLRASLLDIVPCGAYDSVDILETNVDDVTGEVLAACTENLMAAGARDVSLIPCTMKKGRPGWLVRVVCLPQDSRKLSLALARETGTLGVRCLEGVHRFVAERETRTVTVSLCGRSWEVPVKCAVADGVVYSSKPEFSRIQEVARLCSLSAREVAQKVWEEAWRQTARKGP
ncbi:MAG: nickel pincer cofactor biosynthesis protein LarC [Methanolinea sp.]|nr:nickel pincer cofactor biosynthesis protein LarC [Methanolinea sp.]